MMPEQFDNHFEEKEAKAESPSQLQGEEQYAQEERRRQASLEAPLSFESFAAQHRESEKRQALSQQISQSSSPFAPILQERYPTHFYLLRGLHANLQPQNEIDIEHMRPGELVEVVADPRESRAGRYYAACILHTLKPALPRADRQIEEAMVQILRGTYSDFSKHAAALTLQESQFIKHTETLAEMLKDPDIGDFAAVALRGTRFPEGIQALKNGIRSQDPALVQRAALASITTQSSELRNCLKHEWRVRRIANNMISTLLTPPLLHLFPASEFFRRTEIGAKWTSYLTDWMSKKSVQLGELYARPSTFEKMRIEFATLKRLPIASSIYVDSARDSFLTGIDGTGLDIHLLERIAEEEHRQGYMVTAGEYGAPFDSLKSYESLLPILVLPGVLGVVNATSP
jgi:hypothetical protein